LFHLPKSKDDFQEIRDEIVFMIEQNVDLNDVRNIFGQTIAHVCAMRGLTKILNFLVALCAEDSKPLNLLIEHTQESYTPLHLACSRGHEDMAMLILKLTGGKGMQVRDALGMTPVDLAECCVRNAKAKE